MISRWAAALPILAAVACSAPAAPNVAAGNLGGDVARVGRTSIEAALVGEIAGEENVSPRDALTRVLQDSLLAEGARARGLDRSPGVAWASACALARRVSEALRDEANAAGPATEEELGTVTAIHALVRPSPNITESAAQAAAQAIAGAEVGARGDDDFGARARAAAGPLVPVVVERLSPFDASGKTADGLQLDAGFVAAAFGLHAVGETTRPVRSPFGWHVIRLVSRSRPSPEEAERKRQALTGAVRTLRARASIVALLAAKRASTPVVVSSGADDLMAEARAGAP